MLESEWLGTGEDNGEFVAVDWRRQWRVSGWRVELMLESEWLGTGEDNGEFVAVDWR